MSTSAEDLRTIALTEFATSGYAATSLHHIAEVAGLSKSSVLYHYESKDALLAATVQPAITALTGILDKLESRPRTKASRARFIEDFVDFLLDHTLELNLFINQGPALVDVPVIDTANVLVRRLAEYFFTTATTTEDWMRFGVALGGAAYMLASQRTMGFTPTPREETKTVLIGILTELLAPVKIKG
jgi:TetR/AcrR family transcriptional regulator